MYCQLAPSWRERTTTHPLSRQYCLRLWEPEGHAHGPQERKGGRQCGAGTPIKCTLPPRAADRSSSRMTCDWSERGSEPLGQSGGYGGGDANGRISNIPGEAEALKNGLRYAQLFSRGRRLPVLVHAPGHAAGGADMAGSFDGVRPARLDARASVRHVHAGQAHGCPGTRRVTVQAPWPPCRPVLPRSWRYREWQGMGSCTRLDGRPGPLRLQAVPLTYR
jgi:hypothetical protein